MIVVKKMLPRVKLLGASEQYANLIEPITHEQLKPGMVYVKRVDDWWCVFKQTKTGKLRQGGYKHLVDAVSAALM